MKQTIIALPGEKRNSQILQQFFIEQGLMRPNDIGSDIFKLVGMDGIQCIKWMGYSV